jgi:3-methylcrotonyl-CoA carboxylase beta subunit
MLSRLAAGRRRQQLLHPPPAYRSSSSATAAAAAAGGGAAPASASVLPDTLDRGSDAYARNAAAVGGLLADLRARVSQVPPPPSLSSRFHRRPPRARAPPD